MRTLYLTMFSKVYLYSLLLECFFVIGFGASVAESNAIHLSTNAFQVEKSQHVTANKEATPNGHQIYLLKHFRQADGQTSFAVIKAHLSARNTLTRFAHSIFQPTQSPIRLIDIKVKLALLTLSKPSTKWPHYKVLHIVTEEHHLEYRCFTSGRCRIRVLQQNLLSDRDYHWKGSLDGSALTESLPLVDDQLLKRQTRIDHIWSHFTAIVLTTLIGLAVVTVYIVNLCFARIQSQ